MADFNTTECLQAIDLVTSADNVITMVVGFCALVIGIFISSIYSQIKATCYECQQHES